ncbi:unnamed protein product [Timema podura]|uniref:Uncharacterized protein n=1 Tax=Timema podura TaxID=61482 RepID=A0ABN7P4C2_TIMPD|nr:unnamed protein product [Timema podura]
MDGAVASRPRRGVSALGPSTSRSSNSLNMHGSSREGSLLYVLATDYSSYAVYWACTQISSGEGVALQYQVKTGVLSRMTTLPSTTVDDVDSFLPTGVDYLALDHSDCPPQ